MVTNPKPTQALFPMLSHTLFLYAHPNLHKLPLPKTPTNRTKQLNAKRSHFAVYAMLSLFLCHFNGVSGILRRVGPCLVLFQARSAFAMAYMALTNQKAIRRLGPNRSILSAIIRPDAVLLERKGGATGTVMFNNLFPGAEVPMQQLLGDPQEMYCNWSLNNDDEEPLPRGNGTLTDSNLKSSGKKRKSPKENKSIKRVKGHRKSVADKHENGSGKDSSWTRQSWRRYDNDGSRYNRYGDGS